MENLLNNPACYTLFCIHSNKREKEHGYLLQYSWTQEIAQS